MFFQAAAIVLGLLPFTFAKEEFVNHGNTKGWDILRVDNNTKGFIKDSTSVSYAGGTALKFGQEYLGTSYKGRYHSEAQYKNGYKRDEEKYYGFAFRLQSDWEFDPQNYNIAQFIAHFEDINDGECAGASPTTMIWINGNTLWTRTKHGQLLQGETCPPKDDESNCSLGPNCQVTENFKLMDGIKAGVWNRLTIRVKWKSDATGEFQAWLNGTEVANRKKIKTTLLDDHREFKFDVGLYANSWHDDKEMKGTQKKRTLWIDEVGIGSTYADADPDQIKKSA